MANKWPMHCHLVQDTGHDASYVNCQYYNTGYVYVDSTYR